MSTTFRKLITASARTAVATAAVPALLLTGAGAAQAGPADGNPDVWFSPEPGRLVVHVRSWTPSTTNCVYTADGWVTRHFRLPSQGTADVVIAPSVPLFKPWNINVSCDNGKSTAFTYWY